MYKSDSLRRDGLIERIKQMRRYIVYIEKSRVGKMPEDEVGNELGAIVRWHKLSSASRTNSEVFVLLPIVTKVDTLST